jgi:hypothetical protein
MGRACSALRDVEVDGVDSMATSHSSNIRGDIGRTPSGRNALRVEMAFDELAFVEHGRDHQPIGVPKVEGEQVAWLAHRRTGIRPPGEAERW